ncbi:M20 family peptidase [Egibacter rhizosphaerae]|uniref:Peptidase M20 domain-containing protein 2 n=1 Tax=Egibacter rhizosphaerae TaxID=1670831 RepID=A0A411YE64_9ACTN|nr:M20 family metallopeptidase [Egibacter rhizosphaerae]QBI19407.1 M20 family peptidase [Egibacter rhizosphaerae]
MEHSRSPYDSPAQPYQGLLEERFAAIERQMGQAQPVRSPHDGIGGARYDRIAQAVRERTASLVELSHAIHAQPELAFEEHAASRSVARCLAAEGHDVEVGAFGLETAVHARAGTGRPRVAILAEYDALPGIGHACGHNVICATAVGAFLAAAEFVDELGGSVDLIGCPAEEGGGGKEYIARAGGFDDLDCAIMLHPMGVDLAEHPWIGVRQVGVTYHGLPAHASAMPWLGRNALDAVVQAYQGIAQLRQHLLPTDRVHGIITEGGQRANIVPDRTAATFYLRSREVRTLAELAGRSREIFEAAALATGTQLELDWDPCPVYLPVRHNRTLAERYAVNVGGRDRRVLPHGVVPAEMTGSTDLGNVSVRVPAIHPTLAIAPPDVTIHTPAFQRWAASERADAGVIDGAIGLAATAADVLGDPRLREAFWKEFEEAGGRLELEEALTPD